MDMWSIKGNDETTSFSSLSEFLLISFLKHTFYANSSAPHIYAAKIYQLSLNPVKWTAKLSMAYIYHQNQDPLR